MALITKQLYITGASFGLQDGDCYSPTITARENKPGHSPETEGFTVDFVLNLDSNWAVGMYEGPEVEDGNETLWSVLEVLQKSGSDGVERETAKYYESGAFTESITFTWPEEEENE